MKAKDWQSADKLITERKSQAATADSSELSSFPLSELSVDESVPPTVLQGPYVLLSTSTSIHVPQGNQQTMDSAPGESPFLTGDSVHTTTVIIPFISSTGNQCKHGCIPSNVISSSMSFMTLRSSRAKPSKIQWKVLLDPPIPHLLQR